MDNAQTGATHAMPAESVHLAPNWGRRWKRAIVWAVVLLSVAAAVLLSLRYRARHAVSPIRYESLAVDQGGISARVTATGALSALVTVSVGSQVSGRIERLSADYGSAVKKGQVIATIEPALFKTAVSHSQATLSAAQADVVKAQAQALQARQVWKRARQLLSQGLIAVQEFELDEANLGAADAALAAARADVGQADAALKQAKLNLDYCTIRSPIDGMVISRNVDVGQTVAAAFQAPTLFTIAQDLTKMQVDTNVAEADVGKIRAQMPVTFTVDAYPMRVFSGVVRQVRDNAQTIQNVVTYDAVIDVDNSERLLKPSMTATVTFAYATRERVARVPNAALRFRPASSTVKSMLASSGRTASAVPKDIRLDERVVWVLRDGRSIPVKVRIGISDGENTELLAGDLRPGDQVVTEAALNSNSSPARM